MKVHNVSRILDNSNDSIADVVDKLQDRIILPFILNFVSGQFRDLALNPELLVESICSGSDGPSRRTWQKQNYHWKEQVCC